jgi:hypothetical protein
MRLKPKTYIYIFYSVLAGILLSLIFFNSMNLAGERQTTSINQITNPTGGSDGAGQLLPDQRLMQRSQ